MSNFKLNFSHFKHVKSDDKSTTLRHPDGHEITLAHKSLSKPNQTALMALAKIGPQDETEPQAEEMKSNKMADGGKVQRFAGDEDKPEQSEVQPQSADQSQQKGPVVINIGNQPQQPAQQGFNMVDDAKKQNPQAFQQPEQPQAPMQPKPAMVKPAQPQQNAALPPLPAGMDQPIPNQPAGDQGVPPTNPQLDGLAVTDPAKAVQPQDPDSPQAKAQSFLDEQEKYAQDLLNGHITPKTYADLYADHKTTSGKLGMILGMVLGGIGSGLTHQPNVAIEMMNKVIDNDLKAQQDTKVNTQNMLRINQQQVINQANIPKLLAEGKLTEAQAESTKQDALTKAFALTKNQMLMNSFKEYSDKVSAMPEGAKKEQAKAVLGTLLPKLQDHVANVNNMAIAQSALLDTAGITNSQAPQQNPEQSFQKKTTTMKSGLLGPEMKELGQDIESKHMPGVPEVAGQQSSKPVDKADQEKVLAHQNLDNKLKDLMNYASKNEGSVNPTVLKVAAQKAHEAQAFYNQAVDNLGLTPGRLDWLDEQIKTNPTSLIQQVLGNQNVLKEIKDSNQGRMYQKLKTMGFTPTLYGRDKNGNVLKFDAITKKLIKDNK